MILFHIYREAYFSFLLVLFHSFFVYPPIFPILRGMSIRCPSSFIFHMKRTYIPYKTTIVCNYILERNVLRLRRFCLQLRTLLFPNRFIQSSQASSLNNGSSVPFPLFLSDRKLNFCPESKSPPSDPIIFSLPHHFSTFSRSVPSILLPFFPPKGGSISDSHYH